MPDEHLNSILEQFMRQLAADEGSGFAADPGTLNHIYQHLKMANDSAHVGEDSFADSRAWPMKQTFIRNLRPVTSTQRSYNIHLLEALVHVAGVIENLDRSHAGTQARLDNIDVQLETIKTQVNRMNVSLATMDVALDQLADSVRGVHNPAGSPGEQVGADALEGLRARISRVETNQETLFDQVGGASGEAADVEHPAAVNGAVDTGFQQLYSDFEDRFRGSRDQIRSLLTPYCNDVLTVPSPDPVVDIGCGRGEWLELLRDREILSYGVDLNQVVVNACGAEGLDVRCEDAVAHLRSLPIGSVRAVTAFHIVEHLSMDTLIGLIDAAYSALVPGGKLVIETPNCTNLTVGASSFYLDPTHIRPVHPQFLEFLCLHRGFDEAEMRFLHPKERGGNDTGPPEPEAWANPWSARDVDEIDWAIFGPMDYAIIAQKHAIA